MNLTTFLIYLGICFGLSFLIGIERQFRRRIIGLRTTILVSIGAFLYVSMSFIVSNNDLTRIAAQVVCGIGFLGAGVIIKDGLKVRGLTTAATLWCDAAIGVLCAAGAIYQAIAGTFIILFSNTVLRYVNVMINDKVEKNNHDESYDVKITCKSDDVSKIKNLLNTFLKNHHKLEIYLCNLSIVDNSEYADINFKINFPKSIVNYFEKMMDSIYSDYKPKVLQFDRLMDGQNEEEEEAL